MDISFPPPSFVTRGCSLVAPLILGSILISGCRCSAKLGDDSSSSKENALKGLIEAGDVPEFLDGYCYVTFTRDTELLTFDHKPEKTAQKGSTWVVSGWIATPHVLDIGKEGAHEYKVPHDVFDEPFTSNCDQYKIENYAVVFTDTKVYKSDAFQELLCELKRGTSVPRAPGGYALQGTTFAFDLGAFSEQCQGAERGFIRVRPSTENGKERTLRPILFAAHPE